MSDPTSSVNDLRIDVLERELAHIDPIAGRLIGQLAGRMGELRAELRGMSPCELDNLEDLLDDVEHQLAILRRWTARVRAVVGEVR